MAVVAFTSHLRHAAPCEPVASPGDTVAEALDAVFARHPRLRPYVLDDQNRLRRHVAVFLDGMLLPASKALAAPVDDKSEIYVMQALSGG